MYYKARSSGNGHYVGQGILNLKTISEVIVKSSEIQLIFGKNSTYVYVDENQSKKVVEAFMECTGL